MTARDHDVVCDGQDFLASCPYRTPVAFCKSLGLAVEANFVVDINSRQLNPKKLRYMRDIDPRNAEAYLPRVLVIQPWVRRFELVTLRRDQLLEDTIFVS